MKSRIRGLSMGLAIAAVSAGGARVVVARRKAKPTVTGSNYLYIEEFEIPTGAAPNDAVAEASGCGARPAEDRRVQERPAVHAQHRPRPRRLHPDGAEELAGARDRR